MKFIDEVNITVASGKGGPGCVSFRREAKIPRGGPDGGDGGKGGDIVLRANTRLSSLLDLRFQKKYEAGNGLPGEGSKCSGQDGKDLIIEVPPGTLVKDDSGKVLADVDDKTNIVLLKGGRGGKGNHFFKTSVNQAPEHAQPGEPGESLNLHLELKLLADVGIIGFPNAGKSTIISRISAAKPKIADYPFTTLTPNLGVVKVDDEKTFVVADIPGLIEGAHEGTGLGIKFLKHIERTKVFLHVIDASGMSGREPIEDYKKINYELEAYDRIRSAEGYHEPLASRKQIVVLNKCDAAPPEYLLQVAAQFQELGVKVKKISAVTGDNIREVVFQLSEQLFKEEE